jgi:hypothetical protein
LFSYNITSLTASMKKQLNRERINVGRTTYAERVKSVLKSAQSPVVQDLLVDQVARRATGEQCDEMTWIEISHMALNLLHQRRSVAYFTEQQVQERANLVDSARRDGYQVVVITEQQREKLEAQVNTGGAAVRTLENYVREFNASFEYRFIEAAALSADERHVFDTTPAILALVGKTERMVPPIRLSETMRITANDTQGVWDPTIGAIVIKRSKLASIEDYAATLLHEVAHATTGASDVTREFENVLTGYLGHTAVAAIEQRVRGKV